tara:strand:- start:23445 stop:23975 length:531 start_codon:yes stop_codon:yes gene_type:complete
MFAREWLVDFDGANAARRAGYAQKAAKQVAYELLQVPEVQALIAKGITERAKRIEVTQDAVVSELAKIGFANFLDFMEVQSDGSAVVNLKDLTRDEAAAISEIVIDEFKDGRGEDARDVKRIRLKLLDKRGALVDLGRHLRLFPVGKVDVGIGAQAPDPGEADPEERKVNITVAFE